jgi:hypothetical protein
MAVESGVPLRGRVRDRAVRQHDRAVRRDVRERVLDGPDRAPVAHVGQTLGVLQIRLCQRFRRAQIAPVAGGEHKVVKGADAREKGLDVRLVAHVDRAPACHLPELGDGRLDVRRLARTHHYRRPVPDRRFRDREPDPRGPADDDHPLAFKTHRPPPHHRRVNSSPCRLCGEGSAEPAQADTRTVRQWRDRRAPTAGRGSQMLRGCSPPSLQLRSLMASN